MDNSHIRTIRNFVPATVRKSKNSSELSELFDSKINEMENVIQFFVCKTASHERQFDLLKISAVLRVINSIVKTDCHTRRAAATHDEPEKSFVSHPDSTRAFHRRQ